MTLNFEAGYMHAVFPQAITRRFLADRAGAIYAPSFRSRKNTTSFSDSLSGVSRDGGARGARDGV